MTKEEIKKYVDDEFQDLNEEYGLSYEEAYEVVMINLVYRYEIKQLLREDLDKCAEYMEYPLDLDEVDKVIAKRAADREKRRAQRQKRALKKKLEKERIKNEKRHK